MQTPAELAALHFATYACPAHRLLRPRRPRQPHRRAHRLTARRIRHARSCIDFSTPHRPSPRAPTAASSPTPSTSTSTSRRAPSEELLFARAQYLDRTTPPESSGPSRTKSIDVAQGFSLTIVGDVPLGAGLGVPPASVEVCTAWSPSSAPSASKCRSQLRDPPSSASAPRTAFVGANVGIMDQFVICCGQQDNAVMIDTRFLTYTLAPIPSTVRIVICNSMVNHSLADGGGYNTRRAEMEAGLRILQQHRPEIVALRDATMADLEKWGSEMAPESLRRCRHVITEDDRVLAAVEAFRAHDLTRFGSELMHRGPNSASATTSKPLAPRSTFWSTLPISSPAVSERASPAEASAAAPSTSSPPTTPPPSSKPCAPASSTPPASPAVTSLHQPSLRRSPRRPANRGCPMAIWICDAASIKGRGRGRAFVVSKPQRY